MANKLIALFIGLLILVPIVGGLGFVKMDQFKKMGEKQASMPVPIDPVTIASVVQKDWQPRIAAVGSVAAQQGTNVAAEADGIVREIKFEPGSDVKAGDVLVQLDADIEQSTLRNAEAAAELSKVSYTRAKELLASQNISQAEYDTAAANFKQALAQVDNIRAVILRKSVRAPFSGKLGIRQISVGQWLTKGSPVVSLQSLDPIFVEFSLPQQRVGQVKEGLGVIVKSDAYPELEFQGTITAINPDIDRGTRNVRVQSTLPNKDGKLRPGMYVTVEVVSDHSDHVMFIPQTAVMHAPYGDSVYVVEDTKSSSTQIADLPTTPTAVPTTTSLIARQQQVRLGARQGDYVIVTEGVKPTDVLVSTGVFKLKPSAPIYLDNTLAPQFKFEPTPNNT